MVDICIYGGAAIMIIGALIGMFGAIKGYAATKGIPPVDRYRRDEVTLKTKKYKLAWFVLMLIGMVVIGVGISIGS